MSTEQPICQGCYLHPCFLNKFLYLPDPCYTPIKTPEMHMHISCDHVLTSEETEILKKLAESWGIFTKLDNRSEVDDRDFVDAIHTAQRLIALRVARRVNPDIWKQPE